MQEKSLEAESGFTTQISLTQLIFLFSYAFASKYLNNWLYILNGQHGTIYSYYMVF